MEQNTIVVENIDNSYLQLDTEPYIARELSDFFSFMTPNYQFMPKYKNGLWDGKTRLYKIMGSLLPAGLFGILLKFASDNDYKVIDRRTPTKYIIPSDEQIEAFCASLAPYSSGEPIEYYDHQMNSIKYSIQCERATIISATSSGKSLIIYSIIRWYQQFIGGKILIIVPTVNLVSQMYSDFDDYSSADDWSPADNIHKIYQGQKKDAPKKTYVSTYQSMRNKPKDYFKQFDVIICDEVHGAEAKSIINIMDKSINASIRIGLTGTLKNKQLHQLSIIGMFGDIKKVISTRDMIDLGLATRFSAKFLVLKYNSKICKEINRKVVEKVTPSGKKIYRNNYANEMDYIAQCMHRAVFICNLVSVLDGNVLVLFTKVHKQGKPLYNLLKKKLAKDRNVYYISGETEANKRENIRGNIEKETNSILVASYGTLSTGVNIKSLQYVIFASPYKSEIKVLQSIGRILRLKDGKSKAILFDIVDDFRYKKSVNYSFEHFSQRFDIYKREKFPVTISEYKLL